MATTYPAKQRKKQHELEDATYNCVSVRYLESVTESKAEPIEDIRRIVERWRVTGSERAKIYSSAFDAKSRRRRDVGGPLGWGSSGVFHA